MCTSSKPAEVGSSGFVEDRTGLAALLSVLVSRKQAASVTLSQSGLGRAIGTPVLGEGEQLQGQLDAETELAVQQ
jgi:hypothetical protein